jgi:hypothetical protein
MSGATSIASPPRIVSLAILKGATNSPHDNQQEKEYEDS